MSKSITLDKKKIKASNKRSMMTFENFCQLSTVNYFKEQLRSNRYKNLKPSNAMNLSPTQKAYLYLLHGFSNWLTGRTFTYSKMVQTGIDTFKKLDQSITLDNVDHFLRLYQESTQSEMYFVKLIKQYLLDPKHSGKVASSMALAYNAIKSYFEKNDSPIQFKFDPRAKYKTTDEEEQIELSLEDFLKTLTVGKPTITQKAVMLCKFHRGLDTATLCDRFNFQVWEQLIKYFGTEQYMKWDLKLCPVPIKLTRIKTNYTHIGFLDRDAVVAIQDYLEYRFKKIGTVMDEKQPLFLNQKNEAIRESWVQNSFFRLATTAGIQKKIANSKYARYTKDSHELRDLLKSTLIACGTRYDVADHVIGHMPKDSYEKQSSLYADNMRNEFMKASRKLNIFSNLSNYMKSDENNEAMRKEITDMKQEMVMMRGMQEIWTDSLRKKDKTMVIDLADKKMAIMKIKDAYKLMNLEEGQEIDLPVEYEA